MFSSQFAEVFLTYQTFVTNLHLLRVELRCKLQEKLHRAFTFLSPLVWSVYETRFYATFC